MANPLMPWQRRLTEEEMTRHLEQRKVREAKGERFPDLLIYEPIVEKDTNDQTWLIYRRRDGV